MSKTKCTCRHCGKEYEAPIQSDHRILCGDSTSAKDVSRLMDGKTADAVFTSPPYAQQRDYGFGNIPDWDKLMNAVLDRIMDISGKATQIFVNLGKVHRNGEVWEYYSEWIQYARSKGLRYFGQYVWDKMSALPGDWGGRLAPAFEFVFHFNQEGVHPKKTVEKKPGSIKDKTGDLGLRKANGKIALRTNGPASLQTHKIPDDVIRMPNAACQGEAKFGHVAPFPVSLPLAFIDAYLPAGGIVYEPFCGSGTTVIAAEKAGGHCVGMELDPIYCDVIVKRWEEFTGKKAIRIREEVAAVQ
jgi:DNA modification methylase